MKKQVWFETDLGYAATKGKLSKSRDIVGDMQDSQGRLTIWLKNLKDFTVQITTNSKLGITYPEGSNYNVILDQLKPMLVKPDGSPAEIISKKDIGKPKEKPSPDVKLFPKLSKKERKLLEREAKCYALMEEASVNEDEWTPELGAKIRQKYRKLFGLTD